MLTLALTPTLALTLTLPLTLTLTLTRHIKYTPEHMHCLAAFYGPNTPPNTGILCFQVALG